MRRIWKRPTKREATKLDLHHSLGVLLSEARELEEGAQPVDCIALGRLWHRIATLAVDTEQHSKAKTYFGRAIDCYLEAACFDVAAALCRRFIRFYPEVVRAHCTLAFLSLGRQDIGDAVREITTYASAAERSGTISYAIPRLRLMAEATDHADVHRCIATVLEGFGDEEGRDDTLMRMAESALSPEVSEGERWERLLAIVLLNREQLRSRAVVATTPLGGTEELKLLDGL